MLVHRRLAERARQGPSPTIAERYDRRASEAESRAAVLRRILFGEETAPAA
ncbi:MAG TPA: hypothetical protein VML55_23230 [Planctomycetaceae bacterium]|nr:hypothetical protein [Planctomycetaceae bacterium]